MNSLGAYQPNGTWLVYDFDSEGYVELDLRGNLTPAHVGLYDDAGALLTEVEVPFCCTGDFNYASISPVDLSAGSTYHLVMMTEDGVYFGYGSGAQSITFDSNFTVTEMRSTNTNSCCSSLPPTLPENSNGWSFEYVFADLTYELLGCTDATACNYDATAAIDDGSCEFTSCTGCTYSAATNYDSTATIDDGSCVYEVCDITIDNQTIYDEAFAAGVASVICPEVDACPMDLNNDNLIGTSDLLELLAAFGTECLEE